MASSEIDVGVKYLYYMCVSRKYNYPQLDPICAQDFLALMIMRKYVQRD